VADLRWGVAALNLRHDGAYTCKLDLPPLRASWVSLAMDSLLGQISLL
jgi:hypothetical protein